MEKISRHIANFLTYYRLCASPLLLVLALAESFNAFRWLLMVSFLTDAADGYFARRFRVVTTEGSRVDSVADDLTVAAGIVGMLVWQAGFMRQQRIWLLLLAALYLVQLSMALARYGKSTSFHTYLAKIAAVFQGVFLISSFFLAKPPAALFHITAVLTALDIIEEIVLVALLPRWQADVRGLYHILRR